MAVSWRNEGRMDLAITIMNVLIGLLMNYGVWAMALGILLLTVVFFTWRHFRSRRHVGLFRRNRCKRLRNVLRERIEIDHQINDVLAGLVRILRCDRAYINQYHNGGENICGVPFAKNSRTHERVRPGTAPQIAGLQNLPNSVFAGANLAIIRDREICCPDVEALAENDPMGVYHCLKGQGIMAVYQIGMFSFDGVPVGVLGIDFCYGARAIDNHQLESLRACAMKLCGMLLSEQAQTGEEYGCTTGCN
jgi:hypothetical protein